jgi:hypothetical protein
MEAKPPEKLSNTERRSLSAQKAAKPQIHVSFVFSLGMLFFEKDGELRMSSVTGT